MHLCAQLCVSAVASGVSQAARRSNQLARNSCPIDSGVSALNEGGLIHVSSCHVLLSVAYHVLHLRGIARSRDSRALMLPKPWSCLTLNYVDAGFPGSRRMPCTILRFRIPIFVFSYARIQSVEHTSIHCFRWQLATVMYDGGPRRRSGQAWRL